jgi:RHS repeat-associated protein
LGEAFWYNPFGKQDSVIIAGTDRHRFTYNGKEFDEGTELSRYYYGARYYDPELGRFMTPDPIKDDWTPYSYVRNNPIAYSDPTGMSYSGGGGNPELVGSDNPDPDSWGRPDPFDPIAEAIANSMPGDMVTVYNRYGHAIYVHQERTKTSTGENSTKNDKKLDFNLPDTVPDEEVEFDFGLEGSGGDTEEASLGDRVAEILWDDPKFIFAGGVMVYTGVIMTVASGYGIVICAGSGPESWAGIPFLFISGSAGVGVTAEGVTFLTTGFNWRYHTHIPSLSEVDPTHFPNPFKDMK